MTAHTPIAIPDIRVTPVQDIKLSDIDIPVDRARGFDPDETAALAAVIAAVGLQHPVRVRLVGNRLRLVAGMKRLEAARLLGWERIPYTISAAKSDEEARVEEVLENLARPKLKKLDRYHHLYELKIAYEHLNPSATRGGDRRSRKIKLQDLEFDADAPEMFGFTKSAADKIGMSQSAIFAAVKIWKDLTEASRKRCQGTWLADHQAALKLLSEQSAADQKKVLDLILCEPPKATNVPDALTLIANGVVLTHTEKKVAAVKKTLKALPGTVADTVVATQVEARLVEMQKSIATLSKFFGGLRDDELDSVVSEHEDRIIASLKRRGRI